jgi:hypothetical protein
MDWILDIITFFYMVPFSGNFMKNGPDEDDPPLAEP